MTEYAGYEIKRDRDHVVVTAPDGSQWTEDTVTDAMREINERVCVGYWRNKLKKEQEVG